jgi:hypothetical protein
MGLIIETLRAAAPAGVLIADRRLYLTASRDRLVEDGDPAAAWLLAGVGGEILAADVDRLGLAVLNGEVRQPPAVDPPVELQQSQAAQSASVREESAEPAATRKRQARGP